jgi:hypothetical protein
MEWTHLLSHQFMNFTKCYEIGCMKGKFLLLQNVWKKLEYQLHVFKHAAAFTTHVTYILFTL